MTQPSDTLALNHSPASPSFAEPCGIAKGIGGERSSVSRGTLIILVIMSMGSWYIMFVKVYEQAKIFRQYRVVQGHAPYLAAR